MLEFVEMDHFGRISSMSLRQDVASPPSVAQMILDDGTPKKALFTALVVGTILTTINHGDVILSGTVPPFWKMILTYCVPYCVTTWGAVTGKRAQWRRDALSQGST
jgi:hypothetical protein